jgi:hypothetical protein
MRKQAQKSAKENCVCWYAKKKKGWRKMSKMELLYQVTLRGHMYNTLLHRVTQNGNKEKLQEEIYKKYSKTI